MFIVGVMSLYVLLWGMKQVEQIFNEQCKVIEFEMFVFGCFQDFSVGNWVIYIEGLSDDKCQLCGVFIVEYGKDGEGVIIFIVEFGLQLIDEEMGSCFLILEDGGWFGGQFGWLDYNVIGFEVYGLKIESGQV